MVHTFLKKMGYVCGDAQTVIEALMEVVGKNGSIMTPINTTGAVAEMFRQMPGSIRSGHPARSVCAWGKHAAYLTENHDLSNIFGDGSPIGKLYKLNGKVLLLGTGYGKNTSLRLQMRVQDIPGSTPVQNTAPYLKTANESGRHTKRCS